MADREKVIKGLECCVDYDYKCNNCPYQDDGGAEDGCYCDELKTDALALLKAQEPVKPIRLENWWECPSCNGNIVANMKYCPGCGRKVKWDG